MSLSCDFVLLCVHGTRMCTSYFEHLLLDKPLTLLSNAMLFVIFRFPPIHYHQRRQNPVCSIHSQFFLVYFDLSNGVL
jgi:hypothetical protein